MPHFKDQSLIPQEAVRLCALGLLTERDRSLGDLAVEVRRFVSRMLGPSLDILGTSIEALRYQGLVEPLGPRSAPGQSLTGDTILRITGPGREEFHTLITSPVRGQMTDLSRLVVALKLRFFAALVPDERRAELEHLLSASEQDLARLRDLSTQNDAANDLLGDWLSQDIAQTERRIAWYRARIGAI
jgi:hypothetical protein